MNKDISKTTEVDDMRERSFIIIGLVLACVISIAIPVESAVKYVRERENNTSPGEATPCSGKPLPEPGDT
jgi:hypothetical protein